MGHTGTGATLCGGQAVGSGNGPFKVTCTPAVVGTHVTLRLPGKRRIININALLKKLRSGFAAAARESTLSRGLDFGFYQDVVGSAVIEQVFFEDSSLTEQIKYMKRVDILVGVTGSGLTNLAFMKPARDFARSPPISPDLRGLTHTYTYTYAAHLAGLDRGRADVAPRRHRLLLLAHLARAWRARPRRGHVQAPLL